MMKTLVLFFLNISILFGQSQSEMIKGLSLVAPPRPFNRNPFTEIKNVNANWVAVIPYAFCNREEPIVHYDHHSSEKKWWGESRKGVEETICMSKDNGIKVMLKPHIWVRDQWIGNLDYKTIENWEKWEASYESFILPFAQLCEELDVDILCIGTEIKQSIKSRPEFWIALIAKLRKVYKGKLTYAANWDEYEMVTFWNKLDYIGVNAYFPLSDDRDPDINRLLKSWDPVFKTLESTSKKYQRPILFTEYGYLSVDGCAGKTWELESKLSSTHYNPAAQATSLEALFESSTLQEYWRGGFLWKWYDDLSMVRHGIEKDHSPQGKPAENVIRKWYGKMK